jgi:hypothetical protein
MTPPFRLAFARSSASTYSEAVRLAKQSPVYQEIPDGRRLLQVATFGTDPDELKAAAGAMKPDPDLEVGAPRGGQATGPARKPAWFSLRSTNLPSSRASRSIAARAKSSCYEMTLTTRGHGCQVHRHSTLDSAAVTG